MIEAGTRFKNGLYMAAQSFSMLWHQKKLLFYFGIPSLMLFILRIGLQLSENPMYKTFQSWPRIIQFIISAGIPTVIMTFFTIALIHHAAHIMQGQTTTIGKSLGACIPKLSLILLWAIPSILVQLFTALVIETIAHSVFYTILSIAIAIITVAWLLYTFFVLPLIAFKNNSIVEIMKLSGNVTKHSYIEILGGEIWFGLALLVLMIPFMIIWMISNHNFISPVFIFISIFTSEIILRACVSTAHTIFKIMLYQAYLKKFPDVDDIEMITYSRNL